MFLLFSFDNCYPEGGWNDFRGDYNTLEEGIEAANQEIALNVQIINRDTKQIDWFEERGGF